jgi:4-diphosphocytidyl-2-C-methyl-D-erythritol kinase
VGGWAGIAEIAGNDFDAPTFERYPVLGQARNALLDAGAIVAHLSGSGSAVFGVFPDVDSCGAAVALLRDRAPELRSIPTTTL